MLDFKAAKEGFFNGEKVCKELDAASRKSLTRWGVIAMRSARRSIKSGSPGRSKAAQLLGRIVSKPGEPPRSQKGQLKRFLFFGWDPETKSLVVGPSKLPSGMGGMVPGILEKGGHYAGHKNPRRKRRKIGGGGEIRVGGMAGATTKINREGVAVTYGLLKTAAQAARANQLQETLYGPEHISVTVAARPYMGPTLNRELPKLPPLWAGSVHA